MQGTDPWEAVRTRAVEVADRMLFWQGAAVLDPDDVAQEVLLRLRRHALPEGPSGWLTPARRRRLFGFVRNVARELRRKREGVRGAARVRSLEPGLPVEGREPIPGALPASDPAASTEEVAARLASLTEAQARLVAHLLDGTETADIAATLRITQQAVERLAERARDRVHAAQPERRPPPGPFPGPFHGRCAPWNRTLYLLERGWTPKDLAEDAGLSNQAMEQRIRRIRRRLQGLHGTDE